MGMPIPLTISHEQLSYSISNLEYRTVRTMNVKSQMNGLSGKLKKDPSFITLKFEYVIAFSFFCSLSKILCSCSTVQSFHSINRKGLDSAYRCKQITPVLSFFQMRPALLYNNDSLLLFEMRNLNETSGPLCWMGDDLVLSQTRIQF